MFDAEGERGLTTRAALLKEAIKVPDKLNGYRDFLLRKGEVGIWTSPHVRTDPSRSKEIPIGSILWMRLSGENPVPPVKEIQLKFRPGDSDPSYGHVEDRYALVRDGEELPVVVSHEYTEAGKMVFGERVKLMKPGDGKLAGVSMSSQGPFGAGTLIVVENDGEIRAGTHFIPENIDLANIIDEDKRTLTKLTPIEQKFLDAQTRLLEVFGVKDADPFAASVAGPVRLNSADRNTEVVVEPGNIDLLLSVDRNLVRNILRRTKEGSIDQKAIADLLASHGLTDITIGLRLRGGVVRGEMDYGNIGFVTNGSLERPQSRILPSDIYPLLKQVVPLEQSDVPVGAEGTKSSVVKTKLWQPGTLEEYQKGTGSYQVSDEPWLEQIPGSKKSPRKIVGPKRKGGRNRKTYTT